jgi:hypothetical protein
VEEKNGDVEIEAEERAEDSAEEKKGDVEEEQTYIFSIIIIYYFIV